MTKISAIIFVLLQLLSLSGFAQFIAGNHGEGVLFGGKIYLRDLYIQGQLEDIYVGTSENSQIAQRIAGFDRIDLSESQKKLIIRKLSDIEFLSPCLGKIISDLFYLYNWKWTREKFTTPPESEEVTHTPLDQRVVVAKRYRSEILLQKDSWAKMPEAHQVALLIHEMIYSLVRPGHKPVVPGAAYQDVTAVRALVSLFFSKPTAYSKSDLEVLSRELDVNSGVTCESLSRYNIQVQGISSISDSWALRSDSNLERDLKNICSKALAFSSEFRTSLTVQRSPYSLQERRYKAFDGQEGATGTGRQTWIKVCPALPNIYSASFSFGNAETCTATLKQQIFDWGNPKDFNPSPKGCVGSIW